MLKNPQSGQAIVLMALMMLGLMAILGLAIDGGGMFFLNRDAQNTVDAGAVAATYALCTGGDVTFAARQVVERNGFIIDSPRVIDFTVISPPADYAGDDQSEYVEVKMTVEKPAYFIQLVYREPLRITVRAVGHCTPTRVTGVGAALFATSPTCENALSVTGSDGHVVGNVISNQDLHLSSSSTVYEGPGFFLDTDQTSTGTTWLPDDGNPTQLLEPVPDETEFVIEDYLPGGRAYLEAEAAGNLHYYDRNLHINAAHGYTEISGLVVVDGDLRITGNNWDTGAVGGVTFVATGTISFSAETITLNPYIDGLLVFSTANTGCQNAVTLSSSSAVWAGMIYVPNGGVRFSDSGNSTTNGGIVAFTIQIAASNTLITREPLVSPWVPPLLSFAA